MFVIVSNKKDWLLLLLLLHFHQSSRQGSIYLLCGFVVPQTDAEFGSFAMAAIVVVVVGKDVLRNIVARENYNEIIVLALLFIIRHVVVVVVVVGLIWIDDRYCDQRVKRMVIPDYCARARLYIRGGKWVTRMYINFELSSVGI